jgi:hypothetical protein
VVGAEGHGDAQVAPRQRRLRGTGGGERSRGNGGILADSWRDPGRQLGATPAGAWWACGVEVVGERDGWMVCARGLFDELGWDFFFGRSGAPDETAVLRIIF